MLVTCPSCQSIFKLADNNNPDLRMRCSVCSTIFSVNETKVLPDNAPLPGSEPLENFALNSSFSVAKPKKRSMFGRFILIIFFLLMFIAGVLWKTFPSLDDIKVLFSRENISAMEDKNKEIADLFQRVKSLELSNLRQFVVTNEENSNFDKLTVIEGLVVNNFDEPRSFIELEATLSDSEGNVLEKKVQMAGPRISFFQLQVLGKLELEEALADKLSILNYNTEIKPKGSVPFSFVFYNSPDTAANYNVKVTNAQSPEGEKSVDKPKTK